MQCQSQRVLTTLGLLGAMFDKTIINIIVVESSILMSLLVVRVYHVCEEVVEDDGAETKAT